MSLRREFTEYFQSDHQNRNRFETPGDQYLVQLLRGGHVSEALREGQGRRALDIGTGNGFNLVSLDRMGWQGHGVDQTQELLDVARRNLASHNASAVLEIGSNDDLPFASEYFDLLLSFNSVHYADSEAQLTANLAEFARVLAPGGWGVMQAQHPDNWILAGAERIGPRLHRITIDDFRRGSVMFTFKSEADLQETLDVAGFSDCRVATKRYPLLTRTLVHYVAVFRKPLTGSGSFEDVRQ